MHPRRLLLLVVSASTLIWIFHRPMFDYERYVSWNGLLHYGLFFLIIFGSCMLTEWTQLGHPERLTASRTLENFRLRFAKPASLRNEAIVLAAIAGLAQLLWLVRIVMRAGIGPLYDVLWVQRDFLAFKHQWVNVTGISGVTTLTQLGMLASSLYAIYVFGLQRNGHWAIWTLILYPGVLRGLFFSERIALVEVTFPIVVIAILFGRIKVTLPRLAAAALAFIVFFSAAESFRSYAYYSGSGISQEGAYAYGLGRFLDYISSSVNHSVAMPDLSGQKIGFPALLFNGWLQPLIQSPLGGMLREYLQLDRASQAYANIKSSPYSAADYTNMGFFGSVFADSGYMYMLYATVYGWLVGMAFKGIRRFEVGWLALYPAVLISLLESYRLPYLFDVRMFYPLLYLALRYLLQSLRQTGIWALHSGIEKSEGTSWSGTTTGLPSRGSHSEKIAP
jgi:hypothetical protein